MAENVDKQVDARKEPLCILVGILKFLDPKDAKVEDSVQDAKVKVLVDALKADDGWEKIKVISSREEITLRAYIYRHLDKYSIPTEQFPLHDEWNAFKTDEYLQLGWINTLKEEKPGKFNQRAYDSFDKLVKLSNPEVNVKSTKPPASSSASGLPLKPTRRLNTPARNRPGQVKQNDAMLCVALGVLKFLKEGDKFDDLDKMLETEEGWSKVILEKKLKIVVCNEIGNDNVKIANFHSYWIQMKTDTDFKEKFIIFKTEKKQSFLEATWNSFEELLKHQDKDGSSTGGNSEIDVDNEIDKVQVMQGIAQGVLKALEYKVPIDDLREKLATTDGWDSIEIRIILKDFIERKLRAYGHKNFSIHSNWKRIKTDTNSRTNFFEQVRNNFKNSFSDNVFDSFEKLIEEGDECPVSKRMRLNPSIEIQKKMTDEMPILQKLHIQTTLRELWLGGTKVDEAREVFTKTAVTDVCSVILDFFSNRELHQKEENAFVLDHKEQSFAKFLLEFLNSDETLKLIERPVKMALNGSGKKYSDEESQNLLKVAVSYVEGKDFGHCLSCRYRVLKSMEWNCPKLKALLQTAQLSRTATALSKMFKTLLGYANYLNNLNLSPQQRKTLNTLADVIAKNRNDVVYKCEKAGPTYQQESKGWYRTHFHERVLEILLASTSSKPSNTIWNVSNDWVPHPLVTVHGLKLVGKELHVALVFLLASFRRLLNAQMDTSISNEEFLEKVEEEEAELLVEIGKTMGFDKSEFCYYMDAAVETMDLFQENSDKENVIQLKIFDITKTDQVQVSSRNFEAYFKFLAMVCYAANTIEVPGVVDHWKLLTRNQIQGKFWEQYDRLFEKCQLPLYGLAFQVLEENKTILKCLGWYFFPLPNYDQTEQGKPPLVPDNSVKYDYSTWIPISVAEYIHIYLFEEPRLPKSEYEMKMLKSYWSRHPVVKDLAKWLVIQTLEKRMLKDLEPQVTKFRLNRKKCLMVLTTGTMENIGFKQFTKLLFNCFTTKEMREGGPGVRLMSFHVEGDVMEKCTKVLFEDQTERMKLGRTELDIKGLRPFCKYDKWYYERGRIGMLYEYLEFLRFKLLGGPQDIEHTPEGLVKHIKRLQCQNIISEFNLKNMFNLIDESTDTVFESLMDRIAAWKLEDEDSIEEVCD